MAAENTLLICADHIFDAVTDQTYKGYILIRGERIAEVVRGEVPADLAERADKVICFTDEMIMPGITDTHTFFIGWAIRHARGDEETDYSDEGIARLMKTYVDQKPFMEKEIADYCKMLNAQGVTTVKEMGFDDYYGFTEILEEKENDPDFTLRWFFMSQPVLRPMNLEYATEMRSRFIGDKVHFSGFNRMTDALQENREALLKNQETLMQNQKELNETQIRMLQAQLNPHFLGNTLDTMKWIAKINQVPEVAVMSTDLADILRFAISPEEFVTLRRETKALERYIEIQRIRQSGGLKFTVEIPDPLMDCLVPKMMLQPLTENAVIHGLDSSAGGEITVRAEQTEGAGGKELLKITVTDNGSGLPEEMTGSYHRPEGEAAKHHLGLYNVDTILKKHYGEEYGVRLANRQDGKSGAEVSAILPLDRRNNTEQEDA